jgi:hypothetical protein
MDFGIDLNISQRILKKFELKVNSGYTLYRNVNFQKKDKSIYKMKADNNFFINVGVAFLIE